MTQCDNISTTPRRSPLCCIKKFSSELIKGIICLNLGIVSGFVLDRTLGPSPDDATYEPIHRIILNEALNKLTTTPHDNQTYCESVNDHDIPSLEENYRNILNPKSTLYQNFPNLTPPHVTMTIKHDVPLSDIIIFNIIKPNAQICFSHNDL